MHIYAIKKKQFTDLKMFLLTLKSSSPEYIFLYRQILTFLNKVLATESHLKSLWQKKIRPLKEINFRIQIQKGAPSNEMYYQSS